MVYLKIADVPEDASFVGSENCLSCHKEEHAGWQDSLHPKMMRSAAEADVKADITESNPDLSFDPNDIHWVIGSKWEQQFMGHDGETETLLPGAWLVEHEKWKKVGWDGWKVPVPLKRCHGCHTVGLNVETGEFVEPSIGCESCHGKGSWHVDTEGYGKIYSRIDSDTCGQCHARGMSTMKEGFFFPVGFAPGDNLNDYFKFTEPDSLQQNSSQWWGNGSERKRHQQFYAWQQGGHADSLKSLQEGYDGRYGEVEDDCLMCHAGEVALAGSTRDYDLSNVEHGITCTVCHNVHGELDQVRLECDSCHTKGAYYHQPKKNENHVICGKDANVDCVSCHMPLTAKNGGGYTLHSHKPGIVPPIDVVTYEGAPTSCQNGGCHSGQSSQDLQDTYSVFYK